MTELIAPAALLHARRERVLASMAEAQVDALIVTHPPNVFYLTSLQSTAAMAVLTPARLYLLVDFRYSAAVDAASALVRRSSQSEGGSMDRDLVEPVHVGRSYDEALADLLLSLPAGVIGIESAHMSVARFEWLKSRVSPTQSSVRRSSRARNLSLVPVERMIEAARLRKDAHELTLIREGGIRVSRVAREIIQSIVRVGRTEQEIAVAIDRTLREAGFTRPAFESIVASGPNGALPHATPSSRVLSSGDLVVLDFGGVYGGYCVDLTRTVTVGPPSTETAHLHQAVLEAQEAAIAAVRPGISASDVDTAARHVLAGHALGDAFGHATGHGLGLEVHEEPRIGQRLEGRRDERLEDGMVFTIEPGAYVRGLGGVRIEDDVLVTADGCTLLTDVPRELATV